MQYVIAAGVPAHSAADLEAVLAEVDAAAVVDEARTGEIRISTVIRDQQLRALLALPPLAIAPDRVAALPSECCGGCGG